MDNAKQSPCSRLRLQKQAQLQASLSLNQKVWIVRSGSVWIACLDRGFGSPVGCWWLLGLIRTSNFDLQPDAVFRRGLGRDWRLVGGWPRPAPHRWEVGFRAFAYMILARPARALAVSAQKIRQCVEEQHVRQCLDPNFHFGPNHGCCIAIKIRHPNLIEDLRWIKYGKRMEVLRPQNSSTHLILQCLYHNQTGVIRDSGRENTICDIYVHGQCACWVPACSVLRLS